jgi:hypothetical protein
MHLKFNRTLLAYIHLLQFRIIIFIFHSSHTLARAGTCTRNGRERERERERKELKLTKAIFNRLIRF